MAVEIPKLTEAQGYALSAALSQAAWSEVKTGERPQVRISAKTNRRVKDKLHELGLTDSTGYGSCNLTAKGLGVAEANGDGSTLDDLVAIYRANHQEEADRQNAEIERAATAFEGIVLDNGRDLAAEMREQKVTAQSQRVYGAAKAPRLDLDELVEAITKAKEVG